MEEIPHARDLSLRHEPLEGLNRLLSRVLDGSAVQAGTGLSGRSSAAGGSRGPAGGCTLARGPIPTPIRRAATCFPPSWQSPPCRVRPEGLRLPAPRWCRDRTGRRYPKSVTPRSRAVRMMRWAVDASAPRVMHPRATTETSMPGLPSPPVSHRAPPVFGGAAVSGNRGT